MKGQYGPVKLNDGRLGYYDSDKCIRFHACTCIEADKDRCAHVTGVVFLGHPYESRSILIHYNFMEPIERLEIDDAVYTRSAQ